MSAKISALMPEANQASCLCGNIVFTVSGFENNIAHCHCKMCQKFHGAAFSTFAEVKLSNIFWLKGQGQLASYTAGNGTVRQFCKNCGSSLTFESSYNRKDKTIEVALAAFDNLTASIKVNAHIYLSSQASWLKFTDSLPKFLHFRQ